MMVRRAMLLLSAGCFFSCATVFATTPQNASKEPSKSHRGNDRAPSKNKHSSGPVIPPKTQLQQPVPARGGGSVTSRNAHAPATDKSSHTPNPRIASVKPELPGSVVRSSPLPTANRTATASNVRHRGANPATIGGPTGNRPEHTAALSGNHLGRRP